MISTKFLAVLLFIFLREGHTSKSHSDSDSDNSAGSTTSTASTGSNSSTKPEKRRHQMEKSEIWIEETKNFEDGKEGLEAELAHFTRRWGIVNNIKEEMPYLLMLIRQYLEMLHNHRIERASFDSDIFNDLTIDEEELQTLKSNFCERTLNEEVLKVNKIYYDKSNESSIGFTRKILVFLYYEKKPTRRRVIQCPIVVDGEKGFFLYITAFENAEKEEGENYFIIRDFFFENEEIENNEAIIMMRTRLDQKATWSQMLSDWLPVDRIKNFISD